MEIKFNKNLGQNFIFDTNLLRAIVTDAQITNLDTVLEIGAGAGTLTKEISKIAKKVISYEIDKNLKPILENNLINCDNVELIFKDFMLTDINELKGLNKFKVSANLPYYITTPILFKLIESDLDIESITILVQKEVAQRICAKPNSKDYGALTLTIASQFSAKITRIVNRNMFKPSPNVDSAVVHLIRQDNYNEKLVKTIRSLFKMRRKTVVNNLMSSYFLSKAKANEIILSLNLNPLCRAEQLSLDQIKLLNQML